MYRISLAPLAFAPLLACASAPAPYAPHGLEQPAGPARMSVLPSSEPRLTVECGGELASPTGEVCTTRVGGHVAYAVRNTAVQKVEAIGRFTQLERAMQAELGAAPERWVYMATQAGTEPAYPGQNCHFDAIRTSMPDIAVGSAEADVEVAAGRLCMHAHWRTATEEIRVMLVPAVTSALDGPAVPEPDMADHYALRLYRATRDPAVKALVDDAKGSALEALTK